MVRNSNNATEVARAEMWEEAFIGYLSNYNSNVLQVTYMAERSIQVQQDVCRQLQEKALTGRDQTPVALGRADDRCQLYFHVRLHRFRSWTVPSR